MVREPHHDTLFFVIPASVRQLADYHSA